MKRPEERLARWRALMLTLPVLGLLDSGMVMARSEDRWREVTDPAVQECEPFRIFDNLYYVGVRWVSAYLLTTSEGLILIDSLHEPFVNGLLRKIRRLGFSPADLKYILVTHGHFDHAGGARKLQKRTAARVVMSAADWELVQTQVPMDGITFRPPREDLVLADGDTLTLGDTVVRFHLTPGHTPGVLSMEYQVRDGDRLYTALTFGGMGLNFEGAERTRLYIQSVRHLQRLDHLQVNLPNHPGAGDVFQRGARLAERRTGEAHPFVDAQAIQSWLRELLSKAEDKLQAEKEAAGD